MEARRIALGRTIAPLGETAAESSILGRSLATAQVEELGRAGLAVGDGASDVPVLALGDHTWMTGELAKAFLDACPATGGRLAVSGSLLTMSAGLQGLSGEDPAGYPVWLAPRWPMSAEELEALPLVRVDLQETLYEPDSHPAFADVMQAVPMSDRMVHTVSHWSHQLRANLLAWLAVIERERRSFEALPWWRKIAPMLRVIWRAKSLNGWRIAAVLFPQGEGCNIHPTATVEASWLGRNVEVGPHAVVRGCWIGDNVKIGEHARLQSSVVNAGARVTRGTMLNVCVLLEGALVSPGFGHQSTLFGRDCFVAHGVTFFDLSFGGEIRTLHEGTRQPAGTRFLGACVGHRAKLGPHVVVGYGEAIPNDAFLVTDPGRIFRRIPADLPPGQAFAVREGVITALEGGSAPATTQGREEKTEEEPGA